MTGARYDLIADFYVKSWPDAYDDPVSGALFNLAEPLNGYRVLDLACGHGNITRELARRGAQVTGVDISGALLHTARQMENRQPLGIRYVQADLTVEGALYADLYDKVICNFGLSDIDDLDRAVSNVARVLKRNGSFVFSILHPCFPGGTGASSSWPSDGSYYDERWWKPNDLLSTLRAQVGSNHRMLSTYFNTLTAEGLSLDLLQEPLPPAEWSDKCADGSRAPVFLLARFLKT